MTFSGAAGGTGGGVSACEISGFALNGINCLRTTIVYAVLGFNAAYCNCCFEIVSFVYK